MPPANPLPRAIAQQREAPSKRQCQCSKTAALCLRSYVPQQRPKVCCPVQRFPETPRPHPVGRKVLHQRVERRHEHRPRCACKQHQKAEQRQPVQGRKCKNYACEYHCRSRNNPLDRQFTARALQHHRPNYRTHSEKPEQQSITERTLGQPSGHCREQRPERARKEDQAGRAEQQLLNVG